MTAEEKQTIKDWIKTLEGDERSGAFDALGAILAARSGGGGGGGGEPPPVMEIDPDLARPETDYNPDDIDDMDIDDPDDVLKDMTGDSDGDEDDSSEGDDGKDGDDDKDSDGEDKDGKDKDGKDKDGKSSDSDSDGKSDGDGDPGDDDMIDDDDGSMPGDMGKDAKEEKAKKSEAFRRKVELSDLKKQLKRARKKAESGEVSATEEEKKKLDDLASEVEKRFKELADNPDSVTETSAAEFNDFVSEVLDFTDKFGTSHVKIDVKDRIKKIKDVTDDAFAADAIDAEDADNRRKDPEFQKMKAREAEKERLRKAMEDDSGCKGGMEAFKADLQRAIGDQIGDMLEVEEETYAKVNRWHEEDDMAAPGVRIDEIPEENKPNVDVYFDQSGSWGDREVKRGMLAIKHILDLEKEGLLTVNIYYFSQILSQDQAAARMKGSMECWDLVIENIDAAPKTKNVIIMTDTDIGIDWRHYGCHGCKAGPGTSVEGCVWFLWKDGSRVAEAHTKLWGRKGTFEYAV